MKTTILRGLALLAMLSPLVAQAAVPPNDKFENATVLSLYPNVSILNNQTGVGSTPDALDPYINGAKLARSMWYRLDADSFYTHAHLIINDHAGMRAGVFSMTNPDGNAGSLKLVTQTTNTTPNDVETLSFRLAPGLRYYLCVEANGLFDLKLTENRVDNDDFADAATLTGDAGTVTGSNLNANDSGDIPAAVPTYLPHLGVWYQWTPGFTGQAVLDTNFSVNPNTGDPLDTVIAVFTGTTLGNLVNVASADDGGLGNNTRLVFNVAAGTTYKIWVGGYSTDDMGPFYLSYFQEGSPGIFSLDQVPAKVKETAGTATFKVRRWRAGIASSVKVATQNGTAVAGQDFNLINSTLFFDSATGGNPLQTAFEQTVDLTLAADGTPEPTETLSLVLSNPGAGAVLGTPATAVVTIQDSTTAAGFAVPSMTAKETAGTVYVPLSRSSAALAATTYISVFTFSDGVRGIDFELPVEKVNFLPGQTIAYLPVTITNDGKFKGSRSIRLAASSGQADVSLEGNSGVSIAIEDDDLAVSSAGRLTAYLNSYLKNFFASLDMTISASGVATGKVIMARGSLPFTGTLVNGMLTVRLGPSTAPIRTLVIQLTNPATQEYSVTLNDGDLGTTANALVTATHFSKLTPCPQAGYYTYADATGGAGVPALIAGSINVDALGNAAFSGKLFDGTAVVATGGVDSTSKASIGASLYGGKGLVTMQPQFFSAPGPIFSNLSVMRPGRANQAVELPPVETGNITGNVSRYIPPSTGQRALLNWVGGTGHATLSGGGFAGATVKNLSITTANVISVAAPNTEVLKLTLTPSTGLFTGTVIPTGATTAKAIYGFLLQGNPTGLGHGFFVNGPLPGAVDLN